MCVCERERERGQQASAPRGTFEDSRLVCREERATRFFEKEEKEEQEQVEEQEEVYPHLRHVDSRQILQAIPFSISPFLPLRNFSFSFSFPSEDSPQNILQASCTSFFCWPL